MILNKVHGTCLVSLVSIFNHTGNNNSLFADPCRIPLRILKKRVVDFVPSLEVKWTLPHDGLTSGLNDRDGIVTIEPEATVALAYPDAVDLFHKDLRRQKEGRKRSKAALRKTDGKAKGRSQVLRATIRG